MLKQFFILCSGADRDVLEGCPEGEQTKYVGIGATVFFTAVMAFLASAYALFTVFDSIYPALIFGFVWSLLIFNLDRFIVSQLRKEIALWMNSCRRLPELCWPLLLQS